MATQRQDFKIWAGEAKELDIAITGVTDLSSATLQWKLGRTRSSTAMITKSSTAGEITKSSLTATVVLAQADTRDLTGNYIHQLKMLDASNLPSILSEGHVRVIGSMFTT